MTALKGFVATISSTSPISLNVVSLGVICLVPASKLRGVTLFIVVAIGNNVGSLYGAPIIELSTDTTCGLVEANIRRNNWPIIENNINNHSKLVHSTDKLRKKIMIVEEHCYNGVFKLQLKNFSKQILIHCIVKRIF